MIRLEFNPCASIDYIMSLLSQCSTLLTTKQIDVCLTDNKSIVTLVFQFGGRKVGGRKKPKFGFDLCHGTQNFY